jgi:Bacterial SH3 domain.
MKKIVISFALIIALLAVSSGCEPSVSQSEVVVEPQIFLDEESASHATVDADGGLPLRSGPDDNYETIEVIPNRSEVAEKGYDTDNGEWVYIKYGEKHGWVNRKFLVSPSLGGKPVIYLYPQEPTDVNVNVDFDNGRFTCTYPEYNNGWNVKAYPDGKVINKADGFEYSYLYWEGELNVKYDTSKGFVVADKDTAKFLREKLATLGLTPREYNEFIVYWLPLMQGNNYNLITFQEEAYTNAAKLTVTPKPDSVIRVYMVYKPLEKPISIPEQVLKTPKRNGFTVVEWGGTVLGSRRFH